MVNTLRKTQSQGFLLNGVLSLEMAMVNGIMNGFRKRIYGIPFSVLQKKTATVVNCHGFSTQLT
jgi:hypothetical protein